MTTIRESNLSSWKKKQLIFPNPERCSCFIHTNTIISTYYCSSKLEKDNNFNAEKNHPPDPFPLPSLRGESCFSLDCVYKHPVKRVFSDRRC